MARLPTPGGDDGTWGGVLNDYLAQSHNTDGTLKTAAVVAAGAERTANKGVAGGYAPLDGSGLVPASNLPPAGATPDADATTKGVVQLAGDLSGTAASPAIAAGAIDDSNIAASANIAKSKLASLNIADSDVASGANIAQSKIAGLTTDLAAKANDSAVVHDTGDETIAGIKTFSSAPVVPDGSFSQAKVSNLTTDLAGKAAAAHSHAQADITNLSTDLAAKVDESTVTTKGDLLAATGAGAITRLGVGSDNQVLVADTAEATGIKWGSVPAPDDADATTKGVVQLANDLGGTAAAPTARASSLKSATTDISIGSATAPTSGQFLRATNSTTATWQALPRMFGWYLDGVLVVGDGQGPIYRIDADVTILGFDLSAKVAPVTTGATFDVEYGATPNGVFTSIFSVLPTIAAAANVGTAGTLSSTTLNAGVYVRFNVDAVGGTAAQGVTAQLRMETR